MVKFNIMNSLIVLIIQGNVMPQSKISVCALNVTMHPHSPEKYIKLFKKIRDLNLKILVYGDQVLRLSSFYKITPSNFNKKEIYEGEFIKYSDISKNSSWFNTETNEPASEEDKENIMIPKELKPKGGRYSFVFLPQTHLLVYERFANGKGVPPKQLEKYFHEIFKHPDIIEEFGDVNIAILTEPSQINHMLSLKGITSISLRTRKPNPDGLNNVERSIQERFSRINAVEEDRIIKSERGQQLKPDDDFKLEANIAARNGFVKVSRKNHLGHTVRYSSLDKPMERIVSFDPSEARMPFDAIIAEAYKIDDMYIELLTSDAGNNAE